MMILSPYTWSYRSYMSIANVKYMMANDPYHIYMIYVYVWVRHDGFTSLKKDALKSWHQTPSTCTMGGSTDQTGDRLLGCFCWGVWIRHFSETRQNKTKHVYISYIFRYLYYLISINHSISWLFLVIHTEIRFHLGGTGGTMFSWWGPTTGVRDCETRMT